MALRDVVNFNFLKKAIEQRYRFRNDPNNINYKSFKGIPYEPTTNPHSIFGRIYNTFRELIQTKKLVLNQYLNIGEKSVLEKLYLNLKKDPNLKFLDMPDSALNDPRYQLSDEYYQSQPKEITDAQQAEQVPTSTSGGGSVGGMPRMPSAPSISLPRVIRGFKTPQTPQTPKPDIAIANKSGVIKEAPSGSKLVTADSSGALKGLGGESPTSKIFLDKGGTISEHIIKSPSRWNLSAFRSRISNVAKRIQNFASRANPFLKTNLNRIFQGFKSMGGSLLGSLGGFGKGISGPGLTRTANFLGNNGLRGVNAGANFFGGAHQFARIKRISNKASSVTRSVKDRKWLLFLLGLIGLMMLTGLLAINGANQTGTNPPGGIGPGGGGDIASCTFYRGGDKNPGMKLGNPAMATLISNISNKVGVPASIITGIMRVEAPDAFASTDSTYINNDYEAKSSGVAFGLMQFTVGTFVSTYASNWDSMSKLFNKTSQTTTIDPQDKMQPDTVLRIYSIKDSLIAASYKVKDDKQAVNGEGPWDESTVKQVAAKYYGTNKDGTTNYDGWDGSTQNYGNDLWKSYSSCQPQTGTHSTPPPTDQSNLRTSLISQFGVTMDGFDDDHLKWAWEKLWDVSSTKFIAFVKGSVIKTRDSSEQVGCPGSSVAIYLQQFPEELFKYALIHELGHVIRNCPPVSANFILDHMSAYFEEKGITYYANNAKACSGSDNISEDYAETIARYLNPNTSIQMVRSKPPSCLPPSSETVNLTTSFPLHYNVAKSILGDY